MRIWTEEENDYLIKNCRSTDDMEKAVKKLGRTAASIRSHIDYISENRELNFFEKKQSKKIWSVKEEEKLEKMYSEGMYACKIAKTLGRTEGAINNHASLLGLKKEHRSDADLPAPVSKQDIICRDRWHIYKEKKHQENIKRAIEVGTWFEVYNQMSKQKNWKQIK